MIAYAGLLELYLQGLIIGGFMKYPVKIIKLISDDNFELTVPDLPGCKLKGHSIEVVMDGITEVIANHLSILAEYGENIPHASSIDSLMANQPNVIWAVIDFDIVPYLGKSHKINVTLPELLINRIDDRVSKSADYKTRSGFIATACIELLNKNRTN
ncbi:type II toxin-antitoxin system HicB family antitoxin [Thalassotalea piscium]|uniref:Putative RNase H-like HicB family nuclease n=1 Tax=Thalassotalea piscium TaxID=1230533 RepID=A0A7X0TSQ0_9GAMM|nr:type II toxin-antitoxin system HicB family antitoxin [Thalassotalea piscium]MBB6542372.1 putative RNase H-like HicB family nuclease [Thalassotalea piscium]